MEGRYTIARLARAAGVHVETIRYYQRRKLIPLPGKPTGSIRRYTEEDAQRLRFIRKAQAMGFTLRETQSLLKLWPIGSCQVTRKLAAAKIRLVEAKIGELTALRNELSLLVTRCDTNTDEAHCPIIERLTH
jgi:MerR family transcriptional regulator, mercuric resistance operon regulatory protein